MSQSFELLDGTSIPWLAWGTWTTSRKDTETYLDAGLITLAAGIRHMDTAQNYSTEKETGDIIVQSGLKRSDLYIVSKFSFAVPISEVAKAIDESIEKLGTTPDLFLIHSPKLGDLKAIWKIMEDYKDQGKLKSIGVSNFRPQDLEAILEGAKHKPVVNQIEYHPFLLSHLEPVLAIHAKHGIVTESFGPLTPIIRHPTKGGPLRPILERIAARINNAKLVDFEVDPATVLFLWTRARGVVAVSTSGSKENLEKLGKVYQMPQVLEAVEVEEITETGKKYHFRYYTGMMQKDFPLPDLPDGTVEDLL